MGQKTILLISGSPSSTSRSTRLLDEVGARLSTGGLQIRKFSAADFEPLELLNPTSETANIRGLVSAARAASAIVLSTPVYKGTFSGVLKVVVDLIPPDALTGKAGLAIATGRIAEQLPDTANGLAGIFRFFKLGHVVEPLTLTDEQLRSDAGLPLTDAVRALVDARAAALLSAARKAS